MPAKYFEFQKKASEYKSWRWIVSTVLCSVCMLYPLHAEQPAGGKQVGRVDERANPPSMQTFQIPSHGALLNAFVYVAAGAGPHPLVVLLHGFPGNERNLDLAQDIRRAGWDVLYFDYRGSWGSPGAFSFSHAIEDTAAAVALMRDPEMTWLFRLDPSRIVLIGHSMGGFMAVQEAAADPAILAVALISAADLGGRIPQPLPKEREPTAIQRLSVAYVQEGMAPLAGCTPEGLARDTLDHAAQWSFLGKVDALKHRPVMVVSSNDAYAGGDNAFAAALRSAGNDRVIRLHLQTDHVYSSQRSALSTAILHWLATLPLHPRRP